MLQQISSREAKQLNGVWLYLTDTEEAQKMIAEHFFDCPNEENINPEMPTVQILNGTDNPEKLKEVVNKYKEKGYNVLIKLHLRKDIRNY